MKKRGVEVHPRSLLLEDRGADGRAVLARLLAHGRDRVTVLVLRAVDVGVVAELEDVLVVEELGQDDQVGSLARDLVDVPHAVATFSSRASALLCIWMSAKRSVLILPRPAARAAR